MGNLIQGVVTPNILADVFNAILKKVAPKLCDAKWRESGGERHHGFARFVWVCRVEVLRDGADRFEIR